MSVLSMLSMPRLSRPPITWMGRKSRFDVLLSKEMEWNSSQEGIRWRISFWRQEGLLCSWRNTNPKKFKGYFVYFPYAKEILFPTSILKPDNNLALIYSIINLNALNDATISPNAIELTLKVNLIAHHLSCKRLCVHPIRWPNGCHKRSSVTRRSNAGRTDNRYDLSSINI